MDIFIGNIPYDAPAEELVALFAQHGHVNRVHLPVSENGRPRGFGFAIMPVAAQATAAVAALDGYSLRGRRLRVRRADRPVGEADGDPGGRRGGIDLGLGAAAKTTVVLLVPTLFFVVLAAAARLERVSVWVCAAYAVMTLLTFAVYAIDKVRALRGRWRVSEVNLHLLALAGGWPGAFFARHVFRHKTVKRPFRIVFALTVLLNCAGFCWLFTDDGKLAQRKLDQAMSPLWTIVTDSLEAGVRR